MILLNKTFSCLVLNKLILWPVTFRIGFLICLISSSICPQVIGTTLKIEKTEELTPALEQQTNTSTDIRPFKLGEKLVYRISYLETIEAGTAHLDVTSGGSKHSKLFRLRLKAKSSLAINSIYQLNFEYLSIFDLKLGSSREYRKYLRETKKIVRESMTFNPQQGIATLANKKKELKRIPVELGIQDPVSALYFLRTLQLKPGLRIIIPVIEGESIYQVHIKVLGNELISNSIGGFLVHKVEAVIKLGQNFLNNKKITFWFTRDQRKIPVLASVSLAFGSVLVELVEMT